MSYPSQDNAPEEKTGYTAGRAAQLFDLRTVLAGLFTMYGVILVVMSFVSVSEKDMSKTGGIAINLWEGIGMLAVAAFFGIWIWRRP